MTEIMPVPRNSNITVLRPPSISASFLLLFFCLRQGQKQTAVAQDNLTLCIAARVRCKENERAVQVVDRAETALPPTIMAIVM